MGDLPWNSRRSPVLGTNGMVASSQPLASEAGLRILQQGGNAADAAVAMAAALNVTEPCSTGIGGDAFALFFDAKTQKVECILGAGKSPAALTLDEIKSRGYEKAVPFFDALTVTVPGAAAAWCDINKNHGKLPLHQVMAPAIDLAEKGFPVAPITAHLWAKGLPQLQQGGPYAADLLVGGERPPRPGEVFKNPNLANTFKLLVEHGPKGFYEGAVAKAVVEAVRAQGGVLSEEDLAQHETQYDEAISTTYRGVEVWEVPPPTQGITALMALNILERLWPLEDGDEEESRYHSPRHLHYAIESMRLAFADALQHVADPSKATLPTSTLLSKVYAASRKSTLDKERSVHVEAGQPVDTGGNDTVYFCAVDKEGNGCSMINSNYMGFGTGIVPKDCGFTLQNRGHNFSLDPSHPNCVGPSKQPYHTIIPGMCTRVEYEDGGSFTPRSTPNVTTRTLDCCFGVMGGFMQPQGHMQVISNMYDFKMDPQAALDAPRFCLKGVGDSASPADVASSKVLLEDGIHPATSSALSCMGHEITGPVKSYDRTVFGKGQIISRDPYSGVLWGGSDPRADGCAMGW